MLSTDALTLPHPGIVVRAFVAVPLADITPDLRLTNGQTARELAASATDTRRKRMMRYADTLDAAQERDT